MGADRPRTVRPGAHRDPLPHRLPRLGGASRPEGHDRCGCSREPSDPAHLRGRTARDVPREAHEALGDRARRRLVHVRGSGSPAARGRPAAARGAANGGPWRSRLPADSLRGRFVRRALQAAVIDVILPVFAEQVLATGAAGAAPSRDLAARSSVYLQHARTTESSTTPSLSHFEPSGRQCSAPAIWRPSTSCTRR